MEVIFLTTLARFLGADKEWFNRFCSEKEKAFAVINFLLSAAVGLGLKFPKPIPCVLFCPGNFRFKVTSAFTV